MKKNENQSR